MSQFPLVFFQKRPFGQNTTQPNARETFSAQSARLFGKQIISICPTDCPLNWRVPGRAVQVAALLDGSVHILITARNAKKHKWVNMHKRGAC